MLDLTIPQQNALAAGRCVRRNFIWCDARDSNNDPAPAGFWDDIGNVDVGGRTYHGSGSVIQIATLNAVSSLEVAGQQVDINGLDEVGINIARTLRLDQAPVEIHLGIFDPTTRALIGGLIPRFIGFVDTVDIQTPEVGGESKITLTCESTSRALTLQRTDTRSAASCRDRSPSDKFYDYTGVQRDKPLYFGQATPTSVTTAPSRRIGRLPVGFRP